MVSQGISVAAIQRLWIASSYRSAALSAHISILFLSANPSGGIPASGYAPRGIRVCSSQRSGISPYMPTFRSPIRRPALPGFTRVSHWSERGIHLKDGSGTSTSSSTSRIRRRRGPFPNLRLLSGDCLLFILLCQATSSSRTA